MHEQVLVWSQYMHMQPEAQGLLVCTINPTCLQALEQQQKLAAVTAELQDTQELAEQKQKEVHRLTRSVSLAQRAFVASAYMSSNLARLGPTC